MSPPAIRLDVRPAGVAVLTIDQPGSRVNVLSHELWAELAATLAGLSGRTGFRGLVVASRKPGVFIAGADLKLLADAPAPNDPAVQRFIEQGLRVLEQLEALPFPTCAAIDGAALGGGLEVSLACDVRVVGTSDKVKLGLPEVKLGLIPGWGGTQRLPRVIGISEAAEMLTTGRSDTADNAVTTGLAARKIESADLVDEAVRMVLTEKPERDRKLSPLPAVERGTTPTAATNSTAAREAVRVMVAGGSLPLGDAIKLETTAFLQLAGSPESKRLIGEFFASRKK